MTEPISISVVLDPNLEYIEVNLTAEALDQLGRRVEVITAQYDDLYYFELVETVPGAGTVPATFFRSPRFLVARPAVPVVFHARGKVTLRISTVQNVWSGSLLKIVFWPSYNEWVAKEGSTS